MGPTSQHAWHPRTVSTWHGSWHGRASSPLARDPPLPRRVPTGAGAAAQKCCHPTVLALPPPLRTLPLRPGAATLEAGSRPPALGLPCLSPGEELLLGQVSGTLTQWWPQQSQGNRPQGPRLGDRQALRVLNPSLPAGSQWPQGRASPAEPGASPAPALSPGCPASAPPAEGDRDGPADGTAVPPPLWPHSKGPGARQGLAAALCPAPLWLASRESCGAAAGTASASPPRRLLH